MNREDELIDWLRRQQPGRGLHLPGDDGAVVGRGRAARALTVDQQIADVHVPSDLDPAVWARRLLAVNLSDLAALGARPMAALLTLAVPREFPIRTFLKAAVDACREAGVTLSGGDVARSPTPAAGMTLMGRRPPGGRWLRRDAACAGDRLWLGGPVGVSALGQRLVARGARMKGRRVTLPGRPELTTRLARLAREAVRRHLAPEPQLALGEWLGGRRAAAIDVSDGLTRDLARLCRASEVGAVLDLGSLPRPAAVDELAATLDTDFHASALGGGEDYVLLFAVGPRTTPPPRFAARPVGRVVAQRGLWAENAPDSDGGRQPLAPTGWDHLA